MAVDTRDKRGSVLNIGRPYMHILPNPDVGAENQGDRQQLARMYRGINAGAAVVQTGNANRRKTRWHIM